MRLFRLRQVWLPTLHGLLLLTTAGVLAAVLAARSLTGFLGPEAPARGPDGSGARTLVVEGWMVDADLAQAVATYRRGRYERVLVTGGPIDAANDPAGFKTYAARAADLLRRQGLADANVVALPVPDSLDERSYLNALAVRRWAAASGRPLVAVDVFTAGLHARRSRWLHRMALGDAVEVGVRPAVTHEFDAAHWWRSSAGAKATLGEAISLGWTACCFWPPAPR